MMDWILNLLGTDGFPPRWRCGDGWTPFLGWLHILSDTAIWAAYTAIPLAMWYFARKRKDIKFPRVFWLYVAFILSCGLGHLIEAGIFYWPVYRLSGLSKLITAIVSIATVIALIRVLPVALTLPGLAKMNTKLKEQIAQRELAEHKLAHANQVLTARNDELQRFLYSMSHDLKAPVVTTSGFINFIRTDLDQGRTDRLDGWMGRIEDATGTMSAMLEDLLVLGRLGYLEAKHERVDLSKIIDDVVGQSTPVLEEHQAELTVHAGPAAVQGNSEQLRRVLQNLLDNAFAYGKVEGRPLKIEIGCKETEGRKVRLWVADNGPGIAPEFAKKVFNAFERLQNTTKGTGLGLSIVARIAENHKGMVWVEPPPDSDSSGAIFYVELPAFDQ